MFVRFAPDRRAGLRRPRPAADATVAASVGDDPIEVAEVQRMFDLVFRGKKQPAGDLLPMAQAQVLEEIVDRRLVVAYARRVDDVPGDEELAKAKKEFKGSSFRFNPTKTTKSLMQCDV